MLRSYTSYSATSMTIPSKLTKVEDIQIDVVQFKSLIEQDKKHQCEEGLCLYCGKYGYKVDRCPKKR